MTEWREITLGDLCEVTIGRQRSPKHASGPHMIPYVRAANVKDGRLDLSSVLEMNFAPDEQRRFELRRGDVLVTEGCGSPLELGASAVWRNELPGTIGFQNHVLRLRAEEGRSHASFLGPLARWCHHAGKWREIASGTSILNIGLQRARALVVRAPDVATQAKVGEIFETLDELVENNRRRVEVLEEMALAIYREWFVRFRYPGNGDVPLVDSPLGPIPDGWAVEPLFDVADVGFGFSFKSTRFGDRGPFPVVRIRDVPKGTTQTFSNEKPGERYQVIDGDVLIGMDGDFHLGQWSGGVAWLNQRVARLRPRAGMSSRHLMLAVEAPIREWNAAITGTTVAHLGKRHLEQVQVLTPSDNVLKRATVLFDDISQQVIALTQAGRRLTSIRDLLLPKLVTGQIDISHLELDELTEAATA
jgi:type I restriction enzyme S subunit